MSDQTESGMIPMNIRTETFVRKELTIESGSKIVVHLQARRMHPHCACVEVSSFYEHSKLNHLLAGKSSSQLNMIFVRSRVTRYSARTVTSIKTKTIAVV